MRQTARVIAVAAFLSATSISVPTATPAQTNPVCKAHFLGDLVGRFNDDGRSFTLTAPYGFVGANCSIWQVPQGATVDGASIPKPAWSFIGGPFEGRYRNASVIHD